ncbi:MAG: RidA family protein, partial [Psychrobium sp.]|nr:RidA family protein [Psychrobium sp.]
TQVLIYVTERSQLPVFNKVYSEYFKTPFPNRAAMIVAGLAREEMLCEVVAYAAVP